MKLGCLLTPRLFGLAVGLLLTGGVTVPLNIAHAQESSSAEVDASSSGSSDSEDIDEEVVEVTGSRLKRSTYNSVTPLQIISGQLSREAGLLGAAEILQGSTAAGGQQIDLTFGGFVLDNGPGSSTVDLRGLGADRTLILLNGRRIAPAGVEGAPSAPDLSLIPTSLVNQYDVLLDGASSVYGSDAIAGVVNVLLRKDFDGVELEVFSRLPEHGGGEETTFNFAWGNNFDRGFLGFGVEYQQNEPVTLDERPWTAGCETDVEIDQNGNIRTDDLFYSEIFDMPGDGCIASRIVSRVIVPNAVGGSIYYTPGTSNGGWNNFSETNIGGTGIDADGDGIADLNFRDFSMNGRNQEAMLFPEVTRMSMMAYGEYTFEGDANITPYFESLYAKREFYIEGDQGQFFPVVPALNPFNICNPDAEGGVDCGEAYDALLTNPAVVAQIGETAAEDLNGSIGAQAVQPVVAVVGDRNITDVEVEQWRVVAGVRSDLPFINFGSVTNWTFDASVIHSKSTGKSTRPGIRDDRLDLALGAFSTTNQPCENDTGAVLASDINADDCVPVNLFAPSLYEGLIGDFATSAERNYVFDNRDFDTEYEQSLVTAYVTGELFEIPSSGSSASLGFGLEYRQDEIRSVPDNVASEGLLFGFFSDGGAEGEKATKEVFGEIEFPLLAGKKMAEELTVNLSARWTEDELYGSDTTSSLKVGYRPIESLLLRYTVGTSFRAPNLREVFLRSQSGFGNVFDPCFVPAAAINDGVYDPSLDTRDQTVLDNCIADGVDPTSAGGGAFTTYSVEIAGGGSTDLEAETSDAVSAGFSWELPFTDMFDLSIGATYFEIEVQNTIIEPPTQFIVNDCYNSVSGNSVFCDRIQRDPSDSTMSLISNGFLNRDEERIRGIDINIAYDDTLTISGKPIDIGMDVNATQTKSRTTLFVNEETFEQDFHQFAGEWGFPEWKVQTTLRADIADWRFTWDADYIGSMRYDEEAQEDFNDIFRSAGNVLADTCLGPPDDVLCRDYATADPYFLHTFSVYYQSPKGWTVGAGVRNVFDEEPPQVDGSEATSAVTSVTSVNNTPIGYGYDLQGRSLFLNVQYTFGGE